MEKNIFKLYIIIFSVLLFGCGGGGSGSGPEPPDPGPEIVLDPGTYIALGCGITEGSAHGQTIAWPEFLDDMLRGVIVVNLGNSRTYAVYGAYHIEDYILEYKPRCVMVLYGVNDIAAGLPANDILEDLESIVQVCQYYGSDVILGTLPDVPVFTSENRRELVDLNIGIISLCSRYGINYADVYKALRDPSLFRDDGLHPTDEGEDDIAIVYRRVIRDMYGF
ncbi:MAG: SGNH/GDSL hydrolase family protein [Kiritimatiellae bacterium]|jgi:lysophospholipase L1-like esterase|nr:SGNH/GDSL hydrolase family protein [Kiritimatiellia bacterium]